uniref:Leucine rich repeat containing 20 n=1 Tax=Scleropages formosus TaxID=113540 RepID=A0A8C9TMK7_SCLFO
MGEAVANVARRINATVEEERDTLDLSECKLISFPEGVFKVLRSVTEKIHVITLANNEMKALSSKFFTTFTQLRELNLEGNALNKLPDAVGGMENLKSINLARNKFLVFPERLAEIPTLEKISLEGNEITGKKSGIAIWGGNCSGQDSAVHLYLKDKEHSFEDNNIHILAREDMVERGVKEAIYVKLENPSLNRGNGLKHNQLRIT